MLDLFKLTGRGIGLTGGGGHLGHAMALGLAEAGATVVIVGRTEGSLRQVVSEAEASELRGRVVAFVGDVSQARDVRGALDRIDELSGAVSGWVNNACAGAGGRLLELERDAAEATVASVLTDVIVATDLVAQRMSPGGSIVNVSSMYGVVSPYPGVYRDHPDFHNPPAYSAAKAGIIQFTRYAACHLAPRRIRVNSLSPGPFPNPQVQTELSFIETLEGRVPLGRIGRPEELAPAVVYLLSAASSYVTGHNLVVDGGWTAW